MSPDVMRPDTQLFYVSAFVGGTVYIYNQAATKPVPIGQITGLLGPAGIAVTDSGDIYVASQTEGTVSAFHQGNTTPFKVLTGGDTLQGVAVTSSGVVYSNSGYSNKIYVWGSEARKVTKVLTTAFSENCEYIALDAKNNLYVDSIFGEFDEFRAGTSKPVKLFSYSGHNAPFGLAFDTKGNMVVSYADSTIVTYAPPFRGTELRSFMHKGGISAIALSQNNSLLWGGNTTAGVGTEGQAYSYPLGKLRRVTSQTGISADAILGVATYPRGTL